MTVSVTRVTGSACTTTKRSRRAFGRNPTPRRSARTSPRAATQLVHRSREGAQALAQLGALRALHLSVELFPLFALDRAHQELPRGFRLFELSALRDPADPVACFERDVQIQTLHRDTM